MIKEKGRYAQAARQVAKKRHQEEEKLYGLREPKPQTLFDIFKSELPDDQKPFARKLYQMDCQHPGEEETAVLAKSSHETETVWLTCPTCGLTWRWFGTMSATKKAEWASYCPEGFDQFDWEELYTRDKAMWKILYDEAEYSLVEDSMKGGEE